MDGQHTIGWVELGLTIIEPEVFNTITQHCDETADERFFLGLRIVNKAA